MQASATRRCCATRRRARSIAEASSSGIDFAGVLRARARSRRTGAAAAHVPRARGAAQARGEAPDGAQGRVLHAVLRDRRDQGRFAGSTSTAASARCSRTRAAARASCRTAASTSTATSKVLSKTGTFVGQHICVPLEGAAVHINAFNFPVWGMLEKLAPTLLAGVPAIVKPATATAYLTELVVRRIVESGILPEGALQLVCGSARRSVRSSHLPGRRVVHRLGEHRAEAAHASGRSSRIRCASSARPIRSTPVCSGRTPRRASRSSICSCAKWCAR